MPTTTFDDRIYSLVPQSSFVHLQAAFITDLCHSNENIPEDADPLWRAWCRFAFSAIVFGGLAGPHYFKELLNLQWHHIDNIQEGYLLVPRWGGQVPLFVEDIVICYALSLRILTLKSRNRKTMQESSSPLNGFLVPRTSMSEANLRSAETTHAKEMFSRWLDGLRRRAQIKERITPSRLTCLARGRLIQIYNPVIVGTILGLHRYNPAPVAQYSRFDLYRYGRALQPECRSGPRRIDQKSRRYRPRLPLLRQELQQQSLTKQTDRDLPPSFKKMRQIVARYSRTDKKSAHRKRSGVLKQLRSQISRMEQELGKNWTIDWKEYLRSLGQTLPLWKIEGINTVLIAHWMTRLIKRAPPNTVEARLNDLATIIRGEYPILLLGQDEVDLEKRILGLDLSPRSKERVTSTIRAFFHYLSENMGIVVPEIGLWHIGWVNGICELPLLLPDDFDEILKTIRPGRRYVRAAALLGFYFGLRISEVCNLCIGHLWIGSSPIIFVLKSKGGKSRSVEGIDLPTEVLQFMERLRAARLHQTQGNLSKPLLATPGGQPITRQLLSRQWRDAVRRTEIDEISKQTYSVFHSLRHACVNRWLALGIPLVEIARMLGHSSIDTTIRSYAHCFHFLQKEQLAEFTRTQDLLRFTSKGVAKLIGITPRRARQILAVNQVVFTKEGRKRYYSIDPVLDLLIRYPLQSEG